MIVGIRNLILAVVLSATVQVPVVGAYTLGQARWPAPLAGFDGAFDPDQAGPADWEQAFNEAAAAWNQRSAFRFTIDPVATDPCLLPSNGQYRNGVAFAQTRCGGAEFSPGTLAVTISWSIDGELVQTGIVFNAQHHLWDVYDGPWRSSVADFRRVAVHELGHAAGLRHEALKPAIMAPVAGNVLVPQPDDSSGIETLYELGPLLGSSFEPNETGSGAKSAPRIDQWQTLAGDMDGDGLAESVQYRALDGLWQWTESAGATLRQIRLGGPAQQPLIGDFDGDGAAEPATWSTAGQWQVWHRDRALTGWFEPFSGPATASDVDGDGRDELVTGPRDVGFGIEALR